MLHVVSGNNIEFTNYVREKSLQPAQAKYVSNVDTLRGLNDITGVFIGTCYDRPDIASIVQCINIIRTRTAKPLIKLDSLRDMSSHSQIKGKSPTSLIVDEVQSWSQTNVPTPRHTVITQRYTINVRLGRGLREDHIITAQAAKYNSYCNTESRTIFGETSYTFTSWEDAKHFANDTSPDSTFGVNCSGAAWLDSTTKPYDTSTQRYINPYQLDANTASTVYTVSIPCTEAATSTFIIPEYIQEALKHARSFSSYITNTWSKTTCCYQYLFTNSTEAASFAVTCNGCVTTQ